MEYRTIPTPLGRAKLEQAALLGVPLQLTLVEFGDGNGAEYLPTGLETALKRKVYEALPNMLTDSLEAETWVELHAVLPFDAGGWWLREFIVRDLDGHAIFIGNLPESFKPIGSTGAIKDIAFELVFDILSPDSVTLKVDPSKVLATRKYVDDRTQPASETVVGVVELATDAEVQAGADTARAVTPAGLAARTATTTRAGIVELATASEVQTGTDTARAVTPAGLAACTATEARAGVVELATVAEAQAGTDTARAVTPAGLAARTATDARAGVVELATDAEVQTGTDTARAVTPAGLAACTATETRAGVVELATAAEVQAGADTARAVTPAGLAARTATETRAGVVELATSAEAQAGTDAARAVTPVGMAATIGARYASDNVWRDASVTVSLTASRSYERLPNDVVRIFGTITGTADSAGKGTARVNFPFTLAAFRSVLCANWQGEATIGNGYDCSVSMCTTTYVDIAFKTLASGQLRIDYEVTGNL